MEIYKVFKLKNTFVRDKDAKIFLPKVGRLPNFITHKMFVMNIFVDKMFSSQDLALKGLMILFWITLNAQFTTHSWISANGLLLEWNFRAKGIVYSNIKKIAKSTMF